jgi:GR25 family glycosyltransferase involved in LPS biosynthesis
MDRTKFYCLNYNNEKRKKDMQRRFETLGLQCIFYQGVDFKDERISRYSDLLDDATKRVWSCMYGHLDMIHDFYYNTKKDYGIFCEDDIYLHNNLTSYLPRICLDFSSLRLDVLLLGYLLQTNPNDSTDFTMQRLFINGSPFTYFSFPDYVWGTQMYMLSRNHAKYLLDKYGNDSGYAERTITDKSITPFSADWTLTKDGNRAIITPIVVVEDNDTTYENDGQFHFHKMCYDLHFKENLFII